MESHCTENGQADPAGLIAREERQRRRLAALVEVSRVVSSSLDPQVILETVVAKIDDLVGAAEVTIFGLDEETQILRPLVVSAEDRYYDEVMAIRLKVGEGITGHVVQSGVGEIVGHAESDPRGVLVDGTPAEEENSLLCVPLIIHDRAAGAIALSRYGSNQFTQEDLEIVTIFAAHCSVAIANARLYENLRQAFDELRSTQSQLVQSAKLNALGEMAGGVAHDFNNLLAAILGRTQLLLAQVTEPDHRRSLEVIERSALDGAQTVRRIQEFTRLRHDEVVDEVHLNGVLLDVLELTRPCWQTQTKAKGAAIRIQRELLATRPVSGNASELREVFTNLVLNAIDAMPAGGELTLRTREQGESVVVEVEDTGRGMDEMTRARVFDPFFTTKTMQGTGLGLSVAYGIVSRHHGTIAVQSEPGRGTTFTLSFPLRDWMPFAQPPPRLPVVPAALRLLVVDDEEPVLSVLAELLEALDQRVETALGGRAGLAALAAGEAFDAVFTDLGMPDVTGWDVARSAKAGPAAPTVILVTGWGVQIDPEEARQAGVDLVMTKPFTVEDIEGALRRIRQQPAPGPSGSAAAVADERAA